MDKRIMLIINPAAGKGGYKSRLPGIVEVMSRHGFLPTIYMTEKAGDASDFVRREGTDYGRIVCCGGDGTLSEVITGLMDLDYRPPLGYIPMGTANDVATTLGLSKNHLLAAQQTVEGTPTPIDVGFFAPDRYFTYIAAFGAFTEVSYKTSQVTKQRMGHLAYVLNGVASIGQIKAQHTVVEHDGERIEGDFIFGGVTNSTSIAGMVHLQKDLVALGDGKFEVLLIKKPKNINDLGRIVRGVLAQKYDVEEILLFHSAQVSFQFDQPVPWTRDGEDGGEHQQVYIENRASAISLIL